MSMKGLWEFVRHINRSIKWKFFMEPLLQVESFNMGVSLHNIAHNVSLIDFSCWYIIPFIGSKKFEVDEQAKGEKVGGCIKSPLLISKLLQHKHVKNCMVKILLFPFYRSWVQQGSCGLVLGLEEATRFQISIPKTIVCL
jgi:hypothetical protein